MTAFLFSLHAKVEAARLLCALLCCHGLFLISGRQFPGGHYLLRIPIEAGQGFRREAGHHTGLKPATSPM